VPPGAANRQTLDDSPLSHRTAEMATAPSA